MKAYCQGITKLEFMNEMFKHRSLDNFVQGVYTTQFFDGKNNLSLAKGCAVGCSINSISLLKNLPLNPTEHKNFETYLGIPEWIAHVIDFIFEQLPLKQAKKWPIHVADAINEGSDLFTIAEDFKLFILDLDNDVDWHLKVNYFFNFSLKNHPRFIKLFLQEIYSNHPIRSENKFVKKLSTKLLNLLSECKP